MSLDSIANKDPQADMEFYAKVAPIIDSMMDDVISQLEDRFHFIQNQFDQFGQSHSELMVNIYAINKVLIDKGFVTADEMEAAVNEVALGIQKALEEKRKEEQNEPAFEV